MRKTFLSKSCALLLALLLVFPFSACTPSGEGEDSVESEQTTEPAPESTQAPELPSALELLKRAEEIADTYESGVQIITNKMKVGDGTSTEQITLNMKSGDSYSYSMETDGAVSKAVRLEGDTLYYYDPTYGALELSGANEEIYEELCGASGDDEIFDYSNSELYEGGEVEKTAAGYNVSIGLSELGREKLIESMNLGESTAFKFTKFGLTAKINADGSSHEQKMTMELELQTSGVTVTVTAEAEMRFANVNGKVELGGIVEGDYMKFGSCEQFKRFAAANEGMTALYAAALPFSFERTFEMSFNSSSAKPIAKVVYVSGAFDPEKGLNYLVEHKIEGITHTYYSDFNKVIVDEHNGKVDVRPDITTEVLVSSFFNDLAATNIGIPYCNGVSHIKEDGGFVDYRFTIDGEIAAMIGNAYVQNNLGITTEDVSSPGAFYNVRVNGEGRIVNVSLDLSFVFTAEGINFYGNIYDSVGGISYETPVITPLFPIS